MYVCRQVIISIALSTYIPQSIYLHIYLLLPILSVNQQVGVRAFTPDLHDTHTACLYLFVTRPAGSSESMKIVCAAVRFETITITTYLITYVCSTARPDWNKPDRRASHQRPIAEIGNSTTVVAVVIKDPIATLID